MFYFFLGLICGVVLVQEVPTVPKLRPYLERIWVRLQSTSPAGEAAGDPSTAGSKDE